MADAAMMEALARIEHKMDLILHHLPEAVLLTMQQPMSCPVCEVQITYRLDGMGGTVVRACGCRSGVYPASIPDVLLKEETHVPDDHPSRYGAGPRTPGGDPAG